MDELMKAELIDVLGSNYDIPVTPSGGIEVESIGGGQFRCTLPDKRIVIVDQFGNIIG